MMTGAKKEVMKWKQHQQPVRQTGDCQLLRAPVNINLTNIVFIIWLSDYKPFYWTDPTRLPLVPALVPALVRLLLLVTSCACRPSALSVREQSDAADSVTYSLETMNMCKNLFSIFLTGVAIWNKMVSSRWEWAVSGCCWTRAESVVFLTIHRLCDVLSLSLSLSSLCSLRWPLPSLISHSHVLSPTERECDRALCRLSNPSDKTASTVYSAAAATARSGGFISGRGGTQPGHFLSTAARPSSLRLDV